MSDENPIKLNYESGDAPGPDAPESTPTLEAPEPAVGPRVQPEPPVGDHDALPHAPTLFGSAPLQPQPELWRATDLLLFVGFSVIWAFLSGALVLVAYVVLRPWMGWTTPPSALVDNTFFGLFVQLVLYGPLLLYIILLVVVHYRLPFWRGIHWQWPSAGNAVKLLFTGVLLALVVALGSALMPDRKGFPLEKMFSSPSAAYALGAFAVLIAPFMEELIFRGVLFAFFERLAGLRWAVAASALLFAALHYPEYQGAWTHLGMILFVGIVFSLARALTGSVAPSFLLHTAYNGTFIMALFLGTHHFRNLQTLGGT